MCLEYEQKPDFFKKYMTRPHFIRSLRLTNCDSPLRHSPVFLRCRENFPQVIFMHRNFRIVPQIMFGSGSFNQLEDVLKPKRVTGGGFMVFIIDDVFSGKELEKRLPMRGKDLLVPVDVTHEPKTKLIDELVVKIRHYAPVNPDGVIGIGGGSTMDIAKAVSLMLTNPGSSADYQGWDLIETPAIYHVGIPTLAGTGAEISRTCILTGPVKKLGINSDYTLFDQLILDPELIEGVPQDQWFYTGMDCFIHNIESLHGCMLNSFSKAYGEKSLELCREVFVDNHPESAEKLMMASYFGGMSIAYSQVGACHALSYGISYVLGIHHGIGCCIAMNVLEDIYPEGVAEFHDMMKRHNINLPKIMPEDISREDMELMITTTLNLEPLWENCLGKEWRTQMPRERVEAYFRRM